MVCDRDIHSDQESYRSLDMDRQIPEDIPSDAGVEQNQADTALDDEEPFLSAGFLLWMCGILLAIILLRAFVLEVYVVIGDSMDPTLADKQHLLINKLTQKYGSIERGDVLVFTHPDAPEKHLIKRVIALPGERVRLVAGQLEIDNVIKAQPWLGEKSSHARVNTAEYEVPEGSYYVLGDNRTNSRDSRNFGAIPKQRIIGRALFVIWPFATFKML